MFGRVFCVEVRGARGWVAFVSALNEAKTTRTLQSQVCERKKGRSLPCHCDSQTNISKSINIITSLYLLKVAKTSISTTIDSVKAEEDILG